MRAYRNFKGTYLKLTLRLLAVKINQFSLLEELHKLDPGIPQSQLIYGTFLRAGMQVRKELQQLYKKQYLLMVFKSTFTQKTKK